MPELGTYGSVRGALSNERPYRDFGLLAMTLKFVTSEQYPVIRRR
jgi:hypothetical protein